jgi:type III pantothenate kinase
MMLLDVGNSSVKWALCRGSRLAERGRFSHVGDDFFRLASEAWGRLPEPAAVAVANVAGSGMEQAITGWTREKWNITPCYLRATDTAAGVQNAYADPEKLGVDRWASLVAVHRKYDAAVCIIDCGTAITIDAVDADGVHLGGLIMPGLGSMKRSLEADTADIRFTGDDSRLPRTLLARDTRDAVNHGVVYMAAAAIDRIMLDYAAAPGESTEVVITGGDANVLLPLLTRRPYHDPDLVLRGIAVLAGESQCAT